MYRKSLLQRTYPRAFLPACILAAGILPWFWSMTVSAEGIVSGGEVVSSVEPGKALLATAVVLAAGIFAYIKRNKMN